MKKRYWPTTYLAVLSCLLICQSCDKDPDPEPTTPTYTIINNGNAGVSTPNDNQDEEDLAIAQAIPAANGMTYSTNMPVILFFNDKVLLSSLADNFEVTMDNQVVGGTVNINEGDNGYAILTFVPSSPYANNAEITVTLAGGIQDDGGNGLGYPYVISFYTLAFSNGNFNANGGFEQGTSGVFVEGDGGVLSGTYGCVSPFSGNRFCAITTGSSILSSGSAIGGATSLSLLGPISSEVNSVSFKYNFISAEFQEYVGSEFDDSFVMTVFGPKGAYSEFITSVNQIGLNNSICNGFPNMPDDGDAYAGATGWHSKSVQFDNVGSPAYIIFTVTDVSDLQYSSVVALDDIVY